MFTDKFRNRLVVVQESQNIDNFPHPLDFQVEIYSGAPNDNFRQNICSEDDLRSRIFGTFAVKFLGCLLLLGFSNI